MNLSVCIITKNEKENLKECLQRLIGYGFELVVVDTGSTDGTVAMASEYTQAVYEFSWCNDFAKAKNYAVSKASNDKVFVLDSDEFIEAADIPKLELLLKANPRSAGRILRKNYLQKNQGPMEANFSRMPARFSSQSPWKSSMRPASVRARLMTRSIRWKKGAEIRIFCTSLQNPIT